MGRLTPGHEPVLPAELWRRFLVERGRTVRDRLVVHYTPLVESVAGRVASGLPGHVEHGDLVQSGAFGLIDAVERFDPRRGPRFEGFAAPRIRGAILDELRAQDWVPRVIRGRSREVERAKERMQARLGRAVSERELAGEVGLTLDELQLVARAVQVVSVEAIDEGGASLAELIADLRAPDPGAVVLAHETRRHLAVAVADLAERDRAVVRLYYLENRTLAEIGRQLGVTESRVCQLHARLVGRLRGRLAELAAG